MSLNVKRYNKYDLYGGREPLPDNFYLCPDKLKKAFPRTLCKESVVDKYCKIDDYNKKLIEILFPQYTILKSTKKADITQKISYKKPQKKNKNNVPSYWYNTEDTYNIKPDRNQELFKKNPDLKMGQPYPIVFYESDTFKNQKPMESVVKGRNISPWKRTEKGEYKISWDGT